MPVALPSSGIGDSSDASMLGFQAAVGVAPNLAAQQQQRRGRPEAASESAGARTPSAKAPGARRFPRGSPPKEKGDKRQADQLMPMPSARNEAVAKQVAAMKEEAGQTDGAKAPMDADGASKLSWPSYKRPDATHAADMIAIQQKSTGEDDRVMKFVMVLDPFPPFDIVEMGVEELPETK